MELVMFKNTEGKGFSISFENGWTVSVQWGRGSYSDRSKSEGSKTAGVTVFHESNDSPIPMDLGEYADTVAGYQSPLSVARLISTVAELDSKATVDRIVPIGFKWEVIEV